MQHAYDILGIPLNASPNDIKSAYRAAVKANHPDLSSDPAKATKALKEINAAFGALREKAAERPSETRRTATERPQDHASPHRSRPTSVFGGTRKRAEEELQARSDAREHDRQARDWKGDASGLQTRIHRGDADINAAKEMASAGNTPAEQRAAELRALREIRMGRNPQPEVGYKAGKEARIREEALEQARRDLGSGARAKSAPGDPLYMRSASTFGSRDATEVVTTDSQDQMLENALDVEKRKAARERIRSMHTQGATPSVEGYHKAQKISFEGRTMKVHLGSPAVRGRNMIAIPNISQIGSEIRTGKSARLLSLEARRDGSQALGIRDASTIVRGGRDMKVMFVFSEQPENLRAVKSRTRAARGNAR